ncbi:MAG: hypothetical protein DYG94_10355 [Leptolyngbya sp. PLA3]|nr:MAG: hypothetical protein EDM82_09770 [Cyanobacteria bacterium CYA]MCE7969132.1 hypothetical protein [Leptolyngbya sp. PL-A3]
MRSKRPHAQQVQPAAGEWVPAKPLFRFGRAGWVLLAIAVPLAVILITGYDLQTLMLVGIHRYLGDRAMYWMVTCGMPFHALDTCFWEFGTWPSARFGLVSLCLTLVALGVHPKRFRWPTYAAVILLGVLGPPMTVQTMGWLSRGLGMNAGTEYWDHFVPYFGSLILVTLATVLVLHFVTRDPLVVLFVLLAGTFGALMNSDVYAGNMEQSWLFGLNDTLLWMTYGGLWNLCLFAVLLGWAVTARCRWRPPWGCQRCGYDLRGTRSERCPECGAKAEPAAS